MQRFGTIFCQKFHLILSGETTITFSIYPLQTILVFHLVIGVHSGSACRRAPSSFFGDIHRLVLQFPRRFTAPYITAVGAVLHSAGALLCLYLLLAKPQCNLNMLLPQHALSECPGVVGSAVLVETTFTFHWFESRFASMQDMVCCGTFCFFDSIMGRAGLHVGSIGQCHLAHMPGLFGKGGFHSFTLLLHGWWKWHDTGIGAATGRYQARDEMFPLLRNDTMCFSAFADAITPLYKLLSMSPYMCKVMIGVGLKLNSSIYCRCSCRMHGSTSAIHDLHACEARHYPSPWSCHCVDVASFRRIYAAPVLPG